MPTASPKSTRLRAFSAVCCLALLATACGDDDDDTTAPTEGETASADVQEYCDFVEQLDNQGGPPSEEQLLELKEIRPDEIGEQTDAVVDAFIAAEGDVGQVFSDPEIESHFKRMEEHDAKICGFDPPDDEEQPDTEAAEGAEVVPVTAIDFEFEGIPAQVPTGPVAFELTNDGEAAHEMVIFKLGEGADLDELLAADEEPSEEEAQEVGGTFALPGEGGVYANVDLDPGTYAAVCFIPGPEGKSHHELGMKTTFEVG